MKKVNKKRLFLSILILIIIIVAIVMVVKFSGNGDETDGDFNLNGTQENVDSSNSQEGGQEPQQSQPVTTVPEQTVNNATTSVPQQETENVTEFVDESGNKLEEDTLQTNKDSIIQAFKAIPAEKLGITADLSTAKIMFNQGITTIAEKDCFVFNVYVLEEGKLKNIGTYAMSRDTEVLYKLNSETSDYDLIEK